MLEYKQPLKILNIKNLNISNMKKILFFGLVVLISGNIFAAQYDIGVMSLDMNKFYYNDIEYIVVAGKVKNYGTEIVNTYKVNYQVNDGDIYTYNVSGAILAPNAERAFMHPEPIDPVIPGVHTIKVWTSLPNGRDDENPDNDLRTHVFEVYDVNAVFHRTILIEAYTSSTCVPCVAGNANLKTRLEENTGLYSLIKYQMSWPGNGDPYYTLEGGVRRTYYGINSVPWAQIDGSAWTGNSGNVTAQILTNRQFQPAFIDIQVDYYVEGHTVHAKTAVSTKNNISDPNLILYIAIVEKETHENRITSPNESNGEKDFQQVMKKFMPDANGIILGDLKVDVPYINVQEWEFKGNYRRPNNGIAPINHDIEHTVEDFGNLSIVAWIQNKSNKSVEQAANGKDTGKPSVYFTAVNGEYGTISATINDEPVEGGDFVETGKTIVFTALPIEGYMVKEWKVNGEVFDVKSNNSIEIIVNNYIDVTVEFQKINNFSVIYGTINEFGTLSAATADEVEIVSGESLLIGTKIIFTAVPEERYEVSKWVVNNELIPDFTENEYIIESLDKDVDVTVEFLAIPCFSVVYGTANEFGTLSAIADEIEINSGESIIRGTKIIFTATPEEEYEISKWIVNNELIPDYTGNEYVIESLDKDIEVTVDFIEKEVGISNKLLSDIVLYPNPFTNEIIINNPAMVRSIEILDITGRKLLLRSSQAENKEQKVAMFINVSHLTSGIYFVTIENIYSEKIVYKIIKK